MSRRLKVLMSAYACEPGKGSEPEVGWQWALQMARFHDVTVLTRANNRDSIEKGLTLIQGRQPVPEFVYHDESRFLLDLKRGARAHRLYYILWQHSAREVVARLHRERQFDLLHHVTFAAFRYPAAIWGHRVPCIWGPIGGIESIPPRLLPWSHPRSLAHEVWRGVHNLIQTAPFHILPKRAAATTLILASTHDMQEILARHGFEVKLVPTIGLTTPSLPYRPKAEARRGPLRLLFVGNIITLKGVDLALAALSQAGANATLTFIGEGDYLPAARRLVTRLGIENRVSFRGRLPRAEVLRLYPEFDVFVFPSLHDTGGYAVIEAMFNELPVICLDCGGPPLAVREHCGTKVPVTSRAAVVSGLAAAIRAYDQDRERVLREGRAAREVILRDYDWDRKGEQMNDLYHRAAADSAHKESDTRHSAYTGIGGSASILYSMFSFRGMLVGMVALLFVGSLGFLSPTLLKHCAKDIVSDTLPGLSYAGEANAHLADAFRTLLIIVSDDPARREELRRQLDALTKRTSDYLSKYNTQIFSAEDRTNFEALVAVRTEFVRTREHVLALADAGKREEALKIFDHSLIPLQTRVKECGEKLLEYNMRQGQLRGQAIMAICTATQVIVAVFVIAIFILGFFIGLSK